MLTPMFLRDNDETKLESFLLMFSITARLIPQERKNTPCITFGGVEAPALRDQVYICIFSLLRYHTLADDDYELAYRRHYLLLL
jgi:hypothetical protein